MNIYGDLDPVPINRTQFAFKVKKKIQPRQTYQILPIQANILILKYQIVQEIMSLAKVLILGSKETDTIHNTNIHGIYKYLYLSKKDP